MADKAPDTKPAKGLTKRWEQYETSGGLKRKKKNCPKCGAGVFMAQHKDRTTCGNCKYTEFNSKKDSESTEEKPSENKTEEKPVETK